MTIEYGSPLSRGMNRMKKVLFQPFDLGKWFTLGFAAFLADLLDGHGTSSFKKDFHKDVEWREVVSFPDTAWRWLMDNSGWFALILVGIVFLIIIIFVLNWLSSRGKFVFLFNVANTDAKIVQPWHEYKKEGNSLFLWRLLFGIISFVMVISFFIFCFVTIYNLDQLDFGSQLNVLAILGLVLAGFLLFIILGYIEGFLGNFVVPIMYKNRLSTTQGWRIFLSLFSKHAGHFILFGLFKFLLNVIVIIMVVTFGLFTCCIGFLLLIIPYIGSIVLLPISYVFTAFNLEYLEQFGLEYKMFIDTSPKKK